MALSEGTVLSIAVASGKIGYVFLIDGELCNWGVVTKASRSTTSAVTKLKSWLDYFEPDLVVMERLTPQTRKSGQTIKNIKAMQEQLQKRTVKLKLVERLHDYANKYDEASALAERFPKAKAWLVPPRKLWEAEHRHTLIWEALGSVFNFEN